ncbi:MAG: hypothetical protein KAH10_04145 [Flavobacteriales bacterium]|nr:hypothetical protein [Flavobacteriales bacterium]
MKKNVNKGALSPEKYIRTKARDLELKSCYISDNWKSSGYVTIIVSRQHKNSNVTHAIYQVDLLAQGIINTFFEFNLEGSKYEGVINYYIKEQNLKTCSYDLVHSIIYGAEDFSLQFKMKAHKDFALTKFILEPKDFVLKENIEISFGENEKPLVIISALDNKAELIKQLKRDIGSENFKVINIEDLESDDHSHSHTEEEHHHHDEKSFDLPDFIDPMNVLDKENIDNWTESDWEAFENGELEVSAKTTLQIIDFMYDSHFSNDEINDLIKLENLGLNNLNISKNPISENNFFATEEDEKRIRMIFLELLEKPEASHLKLLEEELNRTPNNPHLYSYIANANIKLGNINKAEEWSELAYKNFPNYLFGKISYAQTLLQKGKSEEVPLLFNNIFDLENLLPERKEFHILEVVNFYAIMTLYFTTLGDVASANVYWRLLKELDEREEELVLLAENELMVEKARILKQG